MFNEVSISVFNIAVELYLIEGNLMKTFCLAFNQKLSLKGTLLKRYSKNILKNLLANTLSHVFSCNFGKAFTRFYIDCLTTTASTETYSESCETFKIELF